MRNIHEFEVKNLLRMANDAKERAYVPYSGFRVGACLKGASGAYYFGCNIENAAYSPTVCAERVAMLRAIYEGEREFDALAIVGMAILLRSPAAFAARYSASFAMAKCQ